MNGAAATLASVSFRAFDPARDYPAGAELIVGANSHDHVVWLPTPELLRHEFEHSSNFRPALDARVAERDGRVIGLATGEWRRRGDKIVHHLEAWVRPDERGRGVGNELVAWVEAHEAARLLAGEGGPIDLPHEIGGEGDLDVPGHAALAVKRGYRVVRYFLEMRRRVAGQIPDAPLPEGLEIRPVLPEDHRRIWDADAEAFRDHWEAGERSQSDYDWWFTRPGLDTTLWQVAWAGDQVAGSVLTSMDAEENARLGVRRAWLDHISVRRPFRQRGLAAALIASTLRLLAERGVEEAALGVDAENPTGALRLYERMGFERWRSAVAYRKDLRSA